MEMSSSPFMAALMQQQSAQMSPSTPGTMSAKMAEYAFMAATESHMYMSYDPLLDAGDAPQVPAWHALHPVKAEPFSDAVDGSFGQAFLLESTEATEAANGGGANTSASAGDSHDYDEYRMDEDSESEILEDGEEDGEEEDGIVSHCDEEGTPGPATPANRRTSARAARKNIKYSLTPSPPHTPLPSGSRKSSHAQSHARGSLVDLAYESSSASSAELMGETGHATFLSVPCNNKRALDVAWSEELLDMPIPDLNKYIKSERLSSLSIKALKEARRRKKNRLYAQRSRSKKHTQGELLTHVQTEIGQLKHALCVKSSELRIAQSALSAKNDELRNAQSALCVKNDELRNVRNCAIGLKEKCVKYERELEELRARCA